MTMKKYLLSLVLLATSSCLYPYWVKIKNNTKEAVIVDITYNACKKESPVNLAPGETKKVRTHGKMDITQLGCCPATVTCQIKESGKKSELLTFPGLHCRSFDVNITDKNSFFTMIVSPVSARGPSTVSSLTKSKKTEWSK